MSLKYKVDVLAELKTKGYTTYKLRKESLLSEGALQSIRNDKPISWSNIDQLCFLLDCQPGDILEYVKDDAKKASTEKIKAAIDQLLANEESAEE